MQKKAARRRLLCLERHLPFVRERLRPLASVLLRFPEFEERRISGLRETRLLRVRACERRNLMEERDVLLRQGGAIEVAHAGANVDEGGGEGGG